MASLPKIPRMGDINWERFLSREIPVVQANSPGTVVRQGIRRAFGPDDASLQRKELSPEVLQQLRDDLINQVDVRGIEESSQVVPAGKIRNRLTEITQGNTEQHIGGAIGATGGGLLGAGVGALAMGLAKGRSKAPIGLLGGIPGAIEGYGVGNRAVMNKQLLSMLGEELGPGVQIKHAYAEEGFKEILRELKTEIKNKTFNFSSLKGAVRDLKAGRGRGLIPSERLLLRKHVLGQKTPKPEDAPWLPRKKFQSALQSQADNWEVGKVPKRTPKYKSRVGKTPLAIAGGLAALAALGLGASHLWPRKKDDALRS